MPFTLACRSARLLLIAGTTVGGDVVAQRVGIRRGVGGNRHRRHRVVGGANRAGQIGDGGHLRPGIADDLATGFQLDDAAGLDNEAVAAPVAVILTV